MPETSTDTNLDMETSQQSSLELEVNPPYVGSAFSPVVSISETTDDVTVEITDAIGEHSYTIEKTTQAIADAEQATSDANAAAENANSTASTVAQEWVTTKAEANAKIRDCESAAGACYANSQYAQQKAELADAAATNANNAASAANTAAEQAMGFAQSADSAAQQAYTAISNVNTTINNISQTANQLFGQAGQATIDANAAAQSANTAATNANAKAELADTAAQNADTATTAANNAATTATTAAEQADAAREAIQDDLAAKADVDGYYPKLTAGLADTLMSGDSEIVQFAQRVSDHDGLVNIQGLCGCTVVFNQLTPDAVIDDSNGWSSNTDYAVTSLQGNGIKVTSATDVGTIKVSRAFRMSDYKVPANHKYYIECNIDATGITTPNMKPIFGLYNPTSGASELILNATGAAIGTISDDCAIGCRISNGTPTGEYAVFSDWMIVDLTLAFGAGNEPATIAEFEARFPEDYYPYDAGSLLSVNVEGMKAVGFNQFDKNLAGTVFGYYRMFPSMEYGKNHTLYMGFTDKNAAINVSDISIGFIASDATLPLSSTQYKWVVREGVVQSSHNNMALSGSKLLDSLFIYPNTDEAWQKAKARWNICVNVDNPALNGTYRQYEETTREIPASTYFPNGLRSAGTAYDELDFVNHKAVTRIGAVDLGTLNWEQFSTPENHVFRVVLSDCRHQSNALPANAICGKYQVKAFTPLSASDNGFFGISDGSILAIIEQSCSTVEAFASLVSGVYLFYELAMPTETELPENLQVSYPVEIGGTESIVIPTGEQSAPPTMTIVYGYDADGVRDLSQAIIANIEGATASTNYAIGGYFVHAGKLYKATSAIATGETITPGTNCTQTTVMAELLALTA